MKRLPMLLAVLLLALFAAACGDDEEEAATPEPAATATATPAAAGVGPISRNLDRKPKVRKPAGAPPAELQVSDVVEGSGRAAQPGDVVAVQYVGNSWSTGKQFDASWDRGRQPFAFPLGGGRVIPGWDQGVVGMKEGGRRLLVIPPDLAYGAESPTPDIAPNETLVFVVDLERIR